MSRRSIAKRSLTCWLAVVLLALATSTLAAQDETTQPTPQDPQPAPTGPELNQARLDALRATVDADTALDDAAKKRAIEALDDAGNLLKQRAQADADVASLTQRLTDVDGQVQRMGDQAASLPPPRNLPTWASVEAFDAAQTRAERERSEAQTRAQALASEEQAREARRPEIATQLGELRSKLVEARAALANPIAADVPESVAAALRARQAARVATLEQQVAALSLRQNRYDDLQRLNRAEQQLERAKAERAAQELERLREDGEQLRLAETRQEIRSAQGEVRRFTGTALEPVAAANLERARELEQLVLARGRTVRDRQRFDASRTDLAEKLQLARARVELVGLTKAVGLELRGLRRRQLGEIADLRRREERIRDSLATAYERRFRLEDEARSLADLDAAAAEVRAKLEDETDTPVDVAALRELLAHRAEIVATLATDQRDLTTELVDTDTALKQLLTASEQALEFVNERVLWIPDAAPVWAAAFPATWTGTVEASELLWESTLQLPAAALDEIPLAATAVLLFVATLLLRRRLRAQLVREGETAARRSTVSMRPTWRALGLSLTIAAPAAIALAGSGMVARRAAAGVPDAPMAALASALLAAAIMIATVQFASVVLRPHGLAIDHFGWSAERALKLRRGLRWFSPFLVVAAVTIAADDRLRDAAQRDTLARFVLFVAAVAGGVFAWRQLHPRLPALRGSGSGTVSRRLARALFVAALATTAAIGVLLIAGYVFSAVALAGRIEATIAMLLVGAIVHATIERWIRLSRRHLAMERLLGARAKANDPAAGATGPDLDEVDQQTRSLLATATGIVLAFAIWAIWRDVLPALRILGEVELWSEIVQVQEASGADGSVPTTVDKLRPVTLENIVMAALTLFATWVVTKNVGGLLEITVLRHLAMQAGERYAVTTIVRYVLGAVGAFIAFSTLGVGWSNVQWLVAAVSVGLGFGLQEIFANFVSGLILLLERPIRVGDYVTVSGIDGRVQRIQMRATTIVDWDRKELVVPNREFITSHFMNWSLSNQIVRILVPVGVAYGTDTARARELMLEAARECPAILGAPAPTVVFRGFGDNALQIEVRVFIASMDVWLDAMNQVHTAIDEKLKAAGVEIAFPQRDLHLRSIDPAVYGAGLSLEPRGPRAPAEPSQP